MRKLYWQAVKYNNNADARAWLSQAIQKILLLVSISENNVDRENQEKENK